MSAGEAIFVEGARTRAVHSMGESAFSIGRFLEAVGAVAAAGLAAPASAQVIGLGEDDVWAVVVEFAGLRDWSDTIFRRS